MINNKDINKSIKEKRRYIRREDLYGIEEIEKRKFVRLNYKKNFNYIECDRKVLKTIGKTIDISQYGILFDAFHPPKLNMILSMKFDFNDISEKIALKKITTDDNGDILGKVVRIAECDKSVTAKNKPKIYNVAVAFLKKGL